MKASVYLIPLFWPVLIVMRLMRGRRKPSWWPRRKGKVVC